MSPDDAKIELTFSDSSLYGLRIGDLQLHIPARVLGPKRPEDGGKPAEPGGGAGADQERPGSRAVQVGEPVARALNRRDGARRKPLEDAARFGHGDDAVATAAEEEQLAELAFEL